MSWYVRFTPSLPRFVMQRSRFFTAVAAALVLSAPLSAQTLDSTVIAAFRWRNVGPSNFMGRLSDVQGIPSPSKTVYVAAAAGGVWKSINNGVSWRPIFDDKDVASAGMLAIAPSDTNVVYLGTGEPNSRNTIEPGAGVYKSTDGGAHWTFIGLRETQHIGRVQVDPRNANVVYVAALGPAWKSGGDRGSVQVDRRRRHVEADQGGRERTHGRHRRAARSVEPGRGLPRDVGALSHAVLAQLRRRRLRPLQVDGRRRHVDGDQGQTDIPKARRGASASRSRAAIRRSFMPSPRRRRSSPAPSRSSAIRRRTACIARPTAARRGST